jgi:hypothetical protein
MNGAARRALAACALLLAALAAAGAPGHVEETGGCPSRPDGGVYLTYEQPAATDRTPSPRPAAALLALREAVPGWEGAMRDHGIALVGWEGGSGGKSTSGGGNGTDACAWSFVKACDTQGRVSEL